MIEINPFDELIVNEPRRPEPAVPGLNERPLQLLLARFEQLAHGPVPRSQHRLTHAQLVTSAQPGFGKSHLIGRLFRSLHARATLVYVRPFQNSALAYQSLLATVVKELNFPDRTGGETWRPSDPTQLDALAFGVFAHALADLLEQQGDAEPATIQKLRSDPTSAFGEGVLDDPWGRWMKESFHAHHLAFEQALAARGVALHSPDWLRVLHAYAFSYPDGVIRQACLDWISGQSLSAEQGALIGVRSTSLLDAEAPAEVLNDTARLRLADLCQLASFYRPFVFCFDQTEAYGHSRKLARNFGMIIASLVNDTVNHLTMITSNQSPWLQTIAVHFEDADRERISHPPIALEGLTREQGQQLIELRLVAWGAEQMLPQMQNAKWLDGIFVSDRDRRGTRQFLQLCKERWEELRQRPPAPERTLPQLFEERRLKLLADPKRLIFDADALQWLVKECARELMGVKVQSAEEGYFTIDWETSTQRILFGFEAGSNWRRWEAITRQARHRAALSPPLKVVMFRGAEQPEIPGKGWKVAPVIEAAKSSHLHIVVLTPEDFASIHAGYDLYADALGGDIPPHTGAGVIAFLREIFDPLWQRITGPATSAPPPEPSDRKGDDRLLEEVRTIVSAQKFLSVDEVVTRLSAPGSKEDVLKACGYCPEIRIHSHPQMTVLQWQSL